MTTIAYRDGVLASDSFSTCNGQIVSKGAVKIGGKNGLLWCSSGDAAFGKRFRDWAASGAVGDHPEPPDENSGGVIFLPDDTALVFHVNGMEPRRGLPFYATGSGCDFALGAMQMGATAEEAVLAAMAWDRKTGGEIRVLRR